VLAFEDGDRARMLAGYLRARGALVVVTASIEAAICAAAAIHPAVVLTDLLAEAFQNRTPAGLCTATMGGWVALRRLPAGDSALRTMGDELVAWYRELVRSAGELAPTTH